MKVIYCRSGHYVLRFDKGERWPDAFLDFCRKENVSGAFFYGLGGCSDPEIAFYDLHGDKTYHARKLAGLFEVLNISGNAAMRDGVSAVHAHVVLSDVAYGVYGGHLVSMTVGGTLELSVEKVEGIIERKKDDETGLMLLV